MRTTLWEEEGCHQSWYHSVEPNRQLKGLENAGSWIDCVEFSFPRFLCWSRYRRPSSSPPTTSSSSSCSSYLSSAANQMDSDGHAGYLPCPVIRADPSCLPPASYWHANPLVNIEQRPVFVEAAVGGVFEREQAGLSLSGVSVEPCQGFTRYSLLFACFTVQ